MPDLGPDRPRQPAASRVRREGTEPAAGGQACDVDTSLNEGPVDVEAELLALLGLEGALVAGFVHRVQGQDDALDYGEDLFVVTSGEGGQGRSRVTRETFQGKTWSTSQ